MNSLECLKTEKLKVYDKLSIKIDLFDSHVIVNFEDFLHSKTKED